jgi:predicted PurR-regulated permease PerM
MAALPVAWNVRAVVRATLSVLGVALGFALVYRFSVVLMGLFVAIVLATGILPLVNLLERRRLPRGFSTSLAFVLFFLMIGGLLLVGLPIVSERSQAFAARIPVYQVSLRALLMGGSSTTLRRIVEQMPSTFAIEWPQTSMTNTLGSVGNLLALVAGVLLFSFQWLVHGPAAVRCLLLLAPRGRRAELAEFVSVGQAQLGAFVRGQLLVCASVGTLAFCAYTAMRLPDAFVLALLAALLEVVPLIGPLLGALPAVLVAFTVSPTLALWVIGSAIAIHLVESLLLVPLVMKRAVGVHPALSLLAVTGMGALLGLPGALLAIPTAALAQLAVDRFLYRRRAVSEARARFKSLRTQLGALVAETDAQARPSLAERDLRDRARGLALDFDRLLKKGARRCSRPRARWRRSRPSSARSSCGRSTPRWSSCSRRWRWPRPSVRSSSRRRVAGCRAPSAWWWSTSPAWP